MAFRPRLKGYKFTPAKWERWLARLNAPESAGDIRRREGLIDMRAQLVQTETRLIDGMAEGKAEETGRAKTRLTQRVRGASGGASERH